MHQKDLMTCIIALPLAALKQLFGRYPPLVTACIIALPLAALKHMNFVTLTDSMDLHHSIAACGIETLIN